MTVPPEAVTAAAGAIWDLIGAGNLPVDRGQLADRFATAALEAAAERIANLETALRRFEHLEAAGQAKAVKVAVAAERERIRQMALTWARPPLDARHPIAAQALREFADLIESHDDA